MRAMLAKFVIIGLHIVSLSREISPLIGFSTAENMALAPRGCAVL